MSQASVSLPLQKGFVVKLTSTAKALTAAQKKVADTIWAEQLNKRAGALHNGKIFSVTSVTPEKIEGHFIDYKTYLASWYHPEIFAPPIYSLAVSGLIVAERQVLIGKRSELVTNSPGAYEFVPSGGVDDSCLIADDELEPLIQLRSEFQEETGLSEALISQIDVRFLFLNETKRLYDLCSVLHLTQMAAPSPPVQEYTEQFWLPITEIERFFSKHSGNILDTTLALWENWQGKK